MSHIVTIKSQVRDPAAVAAACRRLNLPEPTHGTAKLYSGEVSGLIVQLPDWAYPVVIDTQSGQASYDIFEGTWGDLRHFERFVQMYCVEKAKSEARARGYAVSEQALSDGSIKVLIHEGGA